MTNRIFEDEDGMTAIPHGPDDLFDWYAGLAMQAILNKTVMGIRDVPEYDDVAELARLYAGAMIDKKIEDEE